MAQDSSQADFWDTRYRGGITPWDAGGVPAPLVEWVGRRTQRGRLLVPGCGAGYEVRFLAERGYDVLAIDFSEAAVAAARAELGALAPLVRQADYFALDDGPFDVLYERAFLCALPRRSWGEWAQCAAGLLRPGGLLAGFFYFDGNARGPPFGAAPAALDALLQDAFERIDDAPVPPEQSIPVFQGKEHWQVWKRKP